MSSELRQPSATLTTERRARLYGYMARVLVAGDPPPEIDANTAAALAGLAMGLRAALVERVRGVTPEQATAATLQWVRDQAALWGSMAATTDDGKAD